MPGKRSPDFRAIYSNVQSFAFTGGDIVISFLRAEPEMNDDGNRYKTGDPLFIDEATVYLPVAQAKDMCAKILHIIDQQQDPADTSTH